MPYPCENFGNDSVRTMPHNDLYPPDHDDIIWISGIDEWWVENFADEKFIELKAKLREQNYRDRDPYEIQWVKNYSRAILESF